MERFAMPRQLVDDVCRALGVDVPIDRDGVVALYRAWCRAVPFDPVAKAAAMAEDRPPPGDDPVEVAERWLSTGLGSTCWGHVTVLGAILDSAGLRVSAGVDRMLRDDLVDFHSFLVVQLDDGPVMLDPIHPSGDLLPLVSGARGDHPVYAVGLDDIDGRLLHWFEQPSGRSRSGTYVVLSTTMDRADVRAFCRVSVEHSGVGRRFFQRRVMPDAFVSTRPNEDGTALTITTWRASETTSVVISEFDEALSALGYRPSAREWLARGQLLDEGSRWAI